MLANVPLTAAATGADTHVTAIFFRRHAAPHAQSCIPQERFKAITTSYLRGAQGIMLVYDVTDRKSFEHVDHWMGQIKQYADLQVDLILVGNKCDLEESRVVSPEQGEQLASTPVSLR